VLHREEKMMDKESDAKPPAGGRSSKLQADNANGASSLYGGLYLAGEVSVSNQRGYVPSRSLTSTEPST
jgi:hypothetical protein